MFFRAFFVNKFALNKLLENNFENSETAICSCPSKFCNTHRKAPMLSRFNKITGLKVCNFILKETPPQLFSYEYQEISKNSYLYGTNPVTASKNG